MTVASVKLHPKSLDAGRGNRLMPNYSRAFAGKYSPGWLRDHEKCCEATKVGADEVVGLVECLRNAFERVRLNESPSALYVLERVPKPADATKQVHPCDGS